MKTALIVHGTCDREEYFSSEYPSLSNSHWLPWLQKELLMHGYSAQTPEMPSAYQPDYSLWKSEFERYSISRQSVLIGHSCGGGFLLRWLSETPAKVSRLILVAPWLDPEAKKCPAFFDFSIDAEIARRMDVHLFESTNDASDIKASISVIRAALPNIQCRSFENYGHFCFSDMGTTAFAELKAVALGAKGSV